MFIFFLFWLALGGLLFWSGASLSVAIGASFVIVMCVAVTGPGKG